MPRDSRDARVLGAWVSAAGREGAEARRASRVAGTGRPPSSGKTKSAPRASAPGSWAGKNCYRRFSFTPPSPTITPHPPRSRYPTKKSSHESMSPLEVPPSPSNITGPPEETDESQFEQWLAVEGGTFQRYDGRVADVIRQMSRMGTASGSRRPIRKRKTKKPAEYFVNHCENTACSFPHGHTSLCSHQLVRGKRGGRRATYHLHRHLAPSPYFDLNESDSD